MANKILTRLIILSLLLTLCISTAMAVSDPTLPVSDPITVDNVSTLVTTPLPVDTPVEPAVDVGKIPITMPTVASTDTPVPEITDVVTTEVTVVDTPVPEETIADAAADNAAVVAGNQFTMIPATLVDQPPVNAELEQQFIERNVMRMRNITAADRQAAADNAADKGLIPGIPSDQIRVNGMVTNALTPIPGGTPDYFGPYGNYAFSQLPSTDGLGNVTPGTGIRKFVDSLPGLGSAGANNLGRYIPIAVADTISYPAAGATPAADYYEIALVQYAEKMHSDIPPTTLREYVQLETPVNRATSKHVPLNYPSGANITNAAGAPVYGYDAPHYLGPLIIAQKDRPVRVKFTNYLPTGSGGNLFIPVDRTFMGAGLGPLGMNTTLNPYYTDNRATLHLHGGATPWISDGTPRQWITPANEATPYPKGVSVVNVPDMDGGVEPDGTMTFYYTNQQSARLMFYHDHAEGITRLNVYVGEAAGYLIQDPAEAGLVANGIIPATQIPLVIQDRTFVPNATQLLAEDPTWNWGTTPGTVHPGDLWWPHVYMPNQNPYDITGASPMGRWDYGPWFWPPFTGITYGPAPNPYYDPVNAPWEPPVIPGTPNPSGVPESFMDTPIVNGQAYPYVQLAPQAYRFRILNACNDRTLNLQLYYAASNATMWDPINTTTLLNGSAGEVSMVPAIPNAGLPASWPTDGRAGGVPDPNSTGPAWIQIGSEGGFLPAPAVINQTPLGFDYNRRSVVVLNVLNKALFIGPAERADVIVDFSGAPNGAKLILYNDGPAPVPAFDPRYDFYTGDPDQTSSGGAPTTLPGYGPNTRTIMQIQINSSLGAPTPFNLAALQAALPAAYAQIQAPPIVPQDTYNTAFGKSYPTNAYAPIQATSMAVFNSLGAVTNVTVLIPGSGFTSVPNVTFTGGNGTGVAATAVLGNGVVANLTLTNGGSGYTSAPTVTISGASGSGATATATLGGGGGLSSINLTNRGSGYTTAPTVTLTGGGGTGATATAALATTGSVKSVTLTNGGKYTAAPTVSFTGGGGTGARGTAILSTTSGLSTVTVTNGGAGYATAPTVGITGGGGTGAAATATLGTTGSISSITVANGGSYTAAPAITISGGGGTGAAATAVLATTSGVKSITVAAAGTGYRTAPTVSITGGGGTGARATATVSGGRITAITVTVAGTGYTTVPTVTISGGGGTGGRGTAVLGRAVASVTVTNRGTGYTSTPTVVFATTSGSGATATAVRGFNIASVAVTAAGTGYTTAPTITFTGGGGTGATATSTISRYVASVTITNGGTGYTTAPTVTFTGGTGSGAVGTATIGKALASVTVTAPGSGYTSAPSVTFTGGSGTGAAGTAILSSGSVGSITLVTPGSGFNSPPTVTFTGGGGTGASATAALSYSVAGIVVTNGGSGYTTPPTVTISGGGGTGAYAAAYGLSVDLQPKSIIEDFDMDYGRMNALLGTEIPRTNLQIQTSLPDFYVDPPTEIFNNTLVGSQIGTAADGSQIWKITHNGVDTHLMHFHMFDVQVINRVGWDGAVRMPDANELGWKDTVRMNPLEDCIVAMRPIVPTLPWELPNSVHLLDVSRPEGSSLPTEFHGVDPNNNPAPVVNHVVNFGHEYVWHCHILGHEEHDMMRSMAVAVAPKIAPTGLTATRGGNTTNPLVTLSWRDNSISESNWAIMRSNATSPWTKIDIPMSTTGPGTGSTVTYIDMNMPNRTTYSYQVLAANVVGDQTVYATAGVGYPTMEADSGPSNTVSVTTL